MPISPPHLPPGLHVLPLLVDEAGSSAHVLWKPDTDFSGYLPTVSAITFKLDEALERLRKELLLAQPFGSLRIDLRWYQVSRSTRRDPVPVRYVLNSPARVLQGAPKWAVIRLDRGEHLGAPLYAQLRTNGPLQMGTVEHRAAKKIAIAIQVLLDKRKANLTTHGALMSSLGRTLAAMKRGLARLDAATPPHILPTL